MGCCQAMNEFPHRYESIPDSRISIRHSCDSNENKFNANNKSINCNLRLFKYKIQMQQTKKRYNLSKITLCSTIIPNIIKISSNKELFQTQIKIKHSKSNISLFTKYKLNLLDDDNRFKKYKFIFDDSTITKKNIKKNNKGYKKMITVEKKRKVSDLGKLLEIEKFYHI